jgi:hypothetical protein
MYANQLRGRVDKVAAWLSHLNDVYDDLLSRPEETGSTPGFDAQPRVKPCEHRAEWQHGRLCLACDNTGWRLRAHAEEGIDPYAAELPRNGTVVSTVETTSSRKAREMARIEAALAILERNERIRAGEEIQEDAILRSLRLVGSRSRTLHKISQAIDYLRSYSPGLYSTLPTGRRGLIALALIVPGVIESPPSE